MGTWSTAILGNDTASEVYERFVALYNLGEDPVLIAGVVLNEQQENILYNKTNVWFGLALACWECKVLTSEIFSTVKEIIESGEDLKVCVGLDASKEFLKDREKKLKIFLAKISVERPKPRLIKKEPREIGSLYPVGSCVAYKNADNVYIGAYIEESEHFRNKGAIHFSFLNFELDHMPTVNDFHNARLLGLETLVDWQNYDYRGTVLGLMYEKDEKENFFVAMAKIFTCVGAIPLPEDARWTNSFKGGWLSYSDVTGVVNVMERFRLNLKREHPILDISLAVFLEKLAAT